MLSLRMLDIPSFRWDVAKSPLERAFRRRFTLVRLPRWVKDYG